MAKTPSTVYKGSLKLDKIDGLRADKTRVQNINVKKEDKFAEPTRSMKTTENTYRGKKY
jgi:hypothetical protein